MGKFYEYDFVTVKNRIVNHKWKHMILAVIIKTWNEAYKKVRLYIYSLRNKKCCSRMPGVERGFGNREVNEARWQFCRSS